MQRILTALSFGAVLLAGTFAAGAAEVDDLAQALKLDETVEVMRAEGLAYGDSLAEELFPGRGGESWQKEVARIYGAERMSGAITEALGAGLTADEVDRLTAFFESEIGAKIIGLEISARRALLDEAVEEASVEHLEKMIEAEDPRLDQLRAYSDANGLVEENVTGAMNANYAFYQGLRAGGAFPFDMSDAEILADVWEQEADIRQDTAEWVLSYLAMAYRPLTDDELDDYIALSQTPAGQALNRALFDGFEVLFSEISHELGMAASRYLASEDI